MTAMLTAVPFRDDTLLASRADDGEVLVAVKPICVALGLAWGSQRLRIMRDAVLSGSVFMMNTVAQDGKNRDVFCLPLRFLNGWLFGIDENRVRAEIRDKVIAYKRECHDVLWRHFQPAPALADAAASLADEDGGEGADDLDPGTDTRDPDIQRLWINKVTLVLRLYGRQAARRVYEGSPLPQIPGRAPVPAAVADAAQTVSDFAAECLTRTEGARLIYAAVYLAYTRWCADRRETPVTKSSFGRHMRAVGYQTKSSGGFFRFLNVQWNGVAG